MKKMCFLLAAGMMMPAVAALKTTWDVGDYVQEGLVMHYDGIRNVGAGQPHDPEAKQWIDLSPSGGYATNRACVWGGRGRWADNAYVATGVACMQTANKVPFGNELTIQVACDIDVTSDERTHPTLFGNDNFLIRMDRSYAAQQAGTNLFWVTDKSLSGWTDTDRLDFAWPKGQYVNAALDSAYAYFMPGTDWSVCSKRWGQRRPRNAIDIPAMSVCIGGIPKGGASGERNYCVKGNVYAVRMYSRKLSNEELSLNRAIDEIRFHGSTATPWTNVVVAAGAVKGLSGAEPAGSYIVDGVHVFTASAAKVGGITYEPVGYRIEIWNAEARAWSEPITFEGDSYEYTVSDVSPLVRLTWRWRVIEGIERYDVHHYVQDALIMHYDGIRNAGAEKEHDSSAAQWIDLSPNAGSAENQACEYGGNGRWSDKSYVFTGVSCMRTKNTVALGGEFTVQIACDLDVTSDDRKWPTIFCGDPSGSPFSLWMDRSWEGQQVLTNVFWTTDKYSGNKNGDRPQTEWKEGKYLNAAFDAEYMYITPGIDWSECPKTWGMRQPRPSPVDLPALVYTIGGRHVGGNLGGRNYCTIGEFYAVRAYSRKLTSEELAYNRDIDEVRFHGAEPTWSNSVYVVSASTEASGAETGAYRLIGEYTFTAPEKVVSGDRKLYVSGSVVETWNATEKKWENPVYLAGSSRKLTVAEANAARRLTWKWKTMNHLRILVR